MKLLTIVLAIVFFPYYAFAYGISKLFNLNGNEDMPTFSEWFGFDDDDDDYVDYIDVEYTEV